MRALVLAAGKGTRMNSDLPKVLHSILATPLVGHVLDTLGQLKIEKTHVVIGAGAGLVRNYLRSREDALRIATVLQKQQLGTGHAVLSARSAFAGFGGEILIWPGDMPLLKAETLKAFMAEHRKTGAEASVLSALRVEPKGYGRILRFGGSFTGIKEELDATQSERRIQEVNTGVYLFKAGALFRSLEKIRPANLKNEFYLTDTIQVLAEEGRPVAAFPLALETEAQGINSRSELAEATSVMKRSEVEKHMENGVTFVSPCQTYVEKGVTIGKDTVIYPWCYLESGVKIGARCQIGPFAKIRRGSVIEQGAIIGSFVEINRSHVGKLVQAKHLAYLGDAWIGAGTNIGAGTITANFDGKKKHKTRLGRNVRVGSNTVFVAPVTVGDNARTGAGSVVLAGQVKKGSVMVGVPARAVPKGKKR